MESVFKVFFLTKEFLILNLSIFGKISVQWDLIKPTVSFLDIGKDGFDELCTFGQVAQCTQHFFSHLSRNGLSIINDCQAF